MSYKRVYLTFVLPPVHYTSPSLPDEVATLAVEEEYWTGNRYRGRRCGKTGHTAEPDQFSYPASSRKCYGRVCTDRKYHWPSAESVFVYEWRQPIRERLQRQKRDAAYKPALIKCRNSGLINKQPFFRYLIVVGFEVKCIFPIVISLCENMLKLNYEFRLNKYCDLNANKMWCYFGRFPLNTWYSHDR